MLPLVAAMAGAQQGLPTPLQEVGFDQRLGEQVPLATPFQLPSGKTVQLADLLRDRPVILVPVYYECPMLCPMVLNGLTSALQTLSFSVGQEFDVIVMSFDERETPAAAAPVQARTLERYARPGTEGGWHFLTGERAAIRAVTESIGFRFEYLPESDEFAHAAGVVALTPEGRVARYFFGIEPAPRDLRLGLVEAADYKIGSVVDHVLLYCYHYDPVTGSYSAVAMNIVRLGAAITVVLVGLLLFGQWQRERRRTATVKA